jgi:hypothetical protein
MVRLTAVMEYEARIEHSAFYDQRDADAWRARMEREGYTVTQTGKASIPFQRKASR